MALPVGDAVLGSSESDLGGVLVAESNIEHDVPTPLPHHLAACHAVPFPRALRVRSEDGVLVVPGPRPSVGARCVTDGVVLELLARRIPRAIEFVLCLVEHVGTHHGLLCPGLSRREDRFVTLPFPGLAIGAGGVTDPGLSVRLAGVPYVVTVALLEDGRTVDVLFPP